MSYSSRVFMYGPVGLLVLIAILYSVFWRVEADTLSARLDSANGGEIIPGVSFSFSQKSVGGFPFRLDVLLTGVNFGYRNAANDIRWRSDRLALHRMAYGRNQFIFEVDGTQTITWSPLQNGASRTLIFTPETARASAILTAGRLVRFDLDVWRARGTENFAQDGEASFSADRAQLHALARQNDTVDVVMQVDNGRAGAAVLALQSSVPLIDCRATLDKAGILAGAATGNDDIARALQLWRDNMGAINVTSLAVNWPDARMLFKGSLTLGQDERLNGELRGVATGENGSQRDMELAFRNGSMAVLGPSAPAAGRPG